LLRYEIIRACAHHSVVPWGAQPHQHENYERKRTTRFTAGSDFDLWAWSAKLSDFCTSPERQIYLLKSNAWEQAEWNRAITRLTGLLEDVATVVHTLRWVDRVLTRDLMSAWMKLLKIALRSGIRV
jgi:hypothetical protein